MTYVIKQITTVEELFKRWNFFYEGWLAVLQHNHGKPKGTTNDYLLLLIRVITAPVDEGCVLVFESKNAKPLGFVVLSNGSEIRGERTLHINMAYSNGKCQTLTLDALQVIEKWAKKYEYTELQLRTYRINGAAQRFFVRKLGFQPMNMIYRKEIC